MKAIILTASTMKKELDGKIYSGKCITAFDWSNNRIVRFVRNRLGAPIENPFCELFHPLDCFEINEICPCPLLCQTENILTDYHKAKKIGRFIGEVSDIHEQYKKIDYGDSSFMLDGSYKLTDISTFKHSLELIRVSQLRIQGKKCSFLHQNRRFLFVSVTDPLYVQSEDTERIIGDAFLVVSIPTDDFNGKGYYKFVASVFPIWSLEEDEDLLFEKHKGWSLQLMCDVHKRTETEIQERLSILSSRIRSKTGNSQ